MRAFHQMLASFRPGDAISNEALVIQKIIRSWGCESKIFAETSIVPPAANYSVSGLDEAKLIGERDAVLLHLSSGSRANRIFQGLDCRKALLYHNITPPEHFQGIQEQTAIAMRRGREQMRQLAGTAEIVMADSTFNADELRAAGYKDPEVMPLLLDFDLIAAKPDRNVIERFDDGKINILFVGRCVPNKRIEDLVATLYYLRNYSQVEARLIHVGSSAGMEQYHALVMTHVRKLGLSGVELMGAVSQAELSACYRSSSVFLCLSEHEGFCIPLIEAMAYDLPILAYDAGAVAETLGSSGVLVREKDYAAIAEMLVELTENAPLRTSLIETQRRRLTQYRSRDLEAELRQHLAPLLN